MKRNEALNLLKSQQIKLKDFSVKSLILFGSVARDEATSESDVDLLVEFEKPVGLFTFVDLQIYLETLLGCSVDLGTPDSLKSYLRETVMGEAVRVF
ncbi:nucleotidyltransferase domain-containing protein [Calothrix sp. NIES-4071]|nr:nucleotidyltransferase domain-containing protein [Calothrix sp. NIES-4071]BAZ63451.1 nucleotidyltransferase domain-containing protein [Calothrix sp. NIES-4105]